MSDTDAPTSGTDDAQEPVGEPRPAAPSRERRTVPAGAFIIAVMVAMALGVLALVALTMGDGSGDDDGDREVRLAAGRFAEQFLSFEHDALDEWKDGVLALTTSGFAEEVEEVESGLRTLISESELDAVTQVTDIFVGEEERGSVDVVIIYDRDIRGGDTERSEADRYLQLSMVRIEGDWLVDNVLDIATAGGVDGPVEGPAEAPVEGDEAPASTASTTTPPTSEGG